MKEAMRPFNPNPVCDKCESRNVDRRYVSINTFGDVCHKVEWHVMECLECGFGWQEKCSEKSRTIKLMYAPCWYGRSWFREVWDSGLPALCPPRYHVGRYYVGTDFAKGDSFMVHYVPSLQWSEEELQERRIADLMRLNAYLQDAYCEALLAAGTKVRWLVPAPEPKPTDLERRLHGALKEIAVAVDEGEALLLAPVRARLNAVIHEASQQGLK